MTALSKVTAGLARKMEPPGRRTGSKVRRNSWPAGEMRPVLLTWAQANERIRAIQRWERKQAKTERRRNRAVGHVGVAAYEFLARRAVNKRGRLDDLSYEALAAIIGYARSAVVAAVKRLKRFGWLDWRRCYEPTGEVGARGPQVRQTFNFFWITAPIKALLEMGIRFGPPPPPDDHDVAAKAGAAENRAHDLADSPLGQALARLGAAVAKRETS